ncbi:MAG TPA: amidohydrolase family protein [Acidimicrobiales bacterium]|nr:amidohydrolase family protein [Acidimicrobiales bacterium]
MARRGGTLEVYPPEGLGPPKDREGHAASSSSGLPPGTEVFSADNHISLSEDIFYDRAPAPLKDRVPRVIYRDDAWNLAAGDRQFLPKEFTGVLTQYDPLPGSSTGDLEARTAQLEADGVARELAFPNALMALLYYPDTEVRELCFRVYNEYLADLQERSAGRFYGVGLINWWSPEGARRTLEELKSFGVRTFVLPLKPGNGPDGKALDYNGPAMTGVWEAIEESGLPIAHHIGEAPLSGPCASNMYAVGMIHNAASFREMFGRYVLTGLLDRHTALRIGWFEGGINWVPAAIQDAEHMYASFRHMLDTDLKHDIRYYWDTHMVSAFMYDPLGLDLVDRIGVDKVMWSSDFPHNESTFGYSEKSLAAVVDALGPEQAARVVSGNVLHYLGLSS